MIALTVPRAVDGASLAARDEVFEDLSRRALQYSENGELGLGLTVAMAIAMEDAVEATDLAAARSRKDLLQSLSEIYNQYPDDALVPYAKLLSTLFQEAAVTPDGRSWQDVVLRELRALALRHPDSHAEKLWVEAELFH